MVYYHGGCTDRARPGTQKTNFKLNGTEWKTVEKRCLVSLKNYVVDPTGPLLGGRNGAVIKRVCNDGSLLTSYVINWTVCA